VLALKENQGTLYRDVVELFTDARQVDFQDVQYDFQRTVNKGHGRIEIRRFWTISDPDFITYVDPKGKWLDLACIGMVEAERRIGDETSRETRYYISSLSGEAVAFAEAVRGHWSIENSCHWVLDIAFREDDCRVRKANGAQNFAILRRIALNLLTQENTAKCGIKAKRLKAGWDEAYLLKVLTG
jgi:predicted transposase YbfD/YdcC